MRRCRRHAASFAVIVCTSAAFAQTPSAAPAAKPAGDRAAIAGLEQRWPAAVAPGGDRKALAGILAEDYIDTDWQGHLRGKAAPMAAAPAKDAVAHVTGLGIRVGGDTAVATGVNHIHSTQKGWTVEVPFTDVFARIHGHWRAVASQEMLRKPAAGGH
ncbi:MAG TPA: nuclear transport factor 2 family protein [Rhodanobacteraceae bacterium]|nr:nuclear transport factor 2 family protein [Rhodanobacteraceae bacterium]